MRARDSVIGPRPAKTTRPRSDLVWSLLASLTAGVGAIVVGELFAIPDTFEGMLGRWHVDEVFGILCAYTFFRVRRPGYAVLAVLVLVLAYVGIIGYYLRWRFGA